MWLPLFLGPLQDCIAALQIALPPTLAAIRRDPTLFLSPKLLSQLFFSHFWVPLGAGVDQNSAQVKRQLITPYASGVVLDLGAGHGHSLPYISRERLTRYIAVEPNRYMHTSLRAAIAKYGLSEEDGSAVILPYGAEEIDKIVQAIGGPHRIDTLLSILTFCSVPHPKTVIPVLCEGLLRPGGTLLFYEHCLSPVRTSRVIQRVWAPIWALVCDGCRMDSDALTWVQQVNWSERHVWTEEGEPEWHLFYHFIGRFVM